MPISRDARMDRRRRFLRGSGDDDVQTNAGERKTARESEAPDNSDPQVKRGAGYSQDVRRACGQRLVQLIPVRKRSFAAVIFVSLLIPCSLLTVHYLIFVTNQLQWWGHPLVILLDAGHPRSIVAWLSSNLWLLCLAATVLTFQLRQHKLDDYNGEYRLWFWLVFTCLVGSLDATTNFVELFGLALDRWSQTSLGWSGPAVVESTLAALIGMLGLRLCTELKTVPLSLVFWLMGLVAWACSAALARQELKLEMSDQIRYWLISATWLGGLTVIWLSALTYLRSIYSEAQRRFLLRGRMAIQTVPWGQRIRESMPSLPGMRAKPREAAQEQDDPAEGARRWGLPGLMKRKSQTTEDAQTAENAANNRKRQKRSSETPAAPTTTRSESASQTKTTSSAPRPDDIAESPATQGRLGGLTAYFKRRPAAAAAERKPEDRPAKKSRFGGWLRKPKDDDSADEYRKVISQPTPTETNRPASENRPAAEKRHEPRDARPEGGAEGSSKAKRKSWMPSLRKPKLPRLPKPNVAGMLSKFKLPKFKLPSLRLAPPGEREAEDGRANATQQPREMRAVHANRPMPSTDIRSLSEDDDDDDSRPLTKAERKRQRRLQQQNRKAG